MTILDNFRGIGKCDKSSMLELIESFPDQCQDAKRIGDGFVLPEGFGASYKNIVCAGLGGSAIGADIARSYAAGEAKIPIFVNRNYSLPNFVDKETLVIASSYSGNTEESLAAYRDARARGAKIIVITSGGKLDKMAEDDGVARINIPGGFPPRAALGYSFFPLLILLVKLGVIKDQEAFIDEAIHNLRKLKNNMIGYKIKRQRNPAKKIANEILNKFIVIYGGQDHIDSVVTRWRGQFAENSKTLASSQIFPEMNHNEIVGWENPKELLKNFAVIILRDSSDNPRTARRMDVTKKILEKDKIQVIEVRSIGKGLLARIFSLIYIGDFVSFYLAILNGIDPTPVERVTYLKKQLAKA
jgi:glucose/mannose-6-phosphate isomerase